MRLLRTIAYWLRRLLRPKSVRWTEEDDYQFEWNCWTEDA